MFTSNPLVACQRYEPRKRPGPLAVSRYRDAAFPVEGSGRPLRSRSISGLFIRSLAFRPATFLSTLRSGCYQTPRKTRYTAAWLRLCRGRHFRRLNSTRLQGATLSKPDVTLSMSSGFPVPFFRQVGIDDPNIFGSCHCGYLYTLVIRHLWPFAMWTAFPSSNYYDHSVAISLAALRRSRVRTS